MNSNNITSFDDLKKVWKNKKSEVRSEYISSYTQKKTNFIPYLLPEDALQLSIVETVDILGKRYGKVIEEVLKDEKTISSPISDKTNTHWIKSSNMIGINLRTVGTLFNVVKYALTIPSGDTLHNSIHILPIWEPGVVGSLYAISSWNLNKEFFSQEMQENYPHLNTVNSQLNTVINLLHLMGFAVGLDVIPHTDRFSEIVLSNPSYFEWIKRKGTKIIDHSNNVHEKVQELIFSFIKSKGSAVKNLSIPKTKEEFFDLHEQERNQILFGKKEDFELRESRREELTNLLFQNGYESAPATMAPPYRGLKVKGLENSSEESDKPEWKDYEIIHPQPMSRVFGPLTRYKFYDNKDDNKNWEVDFSKPKVDVFTYLQEKYYNIQEKFNFDFMRGDMSHVQMRSEGVPLDIDQFYDPLKAVKLAVVQHKPYFSYFAESFLAPPDIMAYGNEIDHLEAADADCVLGDLQSLATNTDEFLQKFAQYLDIKAHRKVTPSFTCITSDKDDPRFDSFYLVGNEFRYFIALFMVDMPSYYSLGFEVRDPHPEPVDNDYYTKLYVFQERDGPKRTSGIYKWGTNWKLFSNLVKIRLFAEQIAEEIQICSVQWLLPPDPAGASKIISWLLVEKDPKYLFIANSESQKELKNLSIPLFDEKNHFKLELVFSLSEKDETTDKILKANKYRYQISSIAPNDTRVYKILTV